MTTLLRHCDPLIFLTAKSGSKRDFLIVVVVVVVVVLVVLVVVVVVVVVVVTFVKESLV